MKRGIFSILAIFAVIVCFGILPSAAQTQTKKKTMSSKSTMPNAAGRMTMSPLDMINNRTTNAQRKAAAASGIKRRAAEASRRQKQQSQTMMQNAPVGAPGGTQLTLDEIYFGGVYPNYANSPLPNVADTVNCSAPNFCGIRKFVDTLPLPNAPNDLGQQLPVAVPDTTTFPGSDYYEISLVDYFEQMHKDLPATKLRGYVQTNGGPGVPHYLGPLIVAQANRPVRIKFTNAVPTVANGGNLFIPVDKTVMGAGMGMSRGTSTYLENRATIHLHGGATPWISDGTPHQWTVPAADFLSTMYPRGDSVQFVPDMFFVNGAVVPQCSATVTTNCSPANLLSTPSTLPAGATNDPGPGSLTFYYTNQQSGRLMFYHDHAYGTTRLNVYAGEAAGYLLVDSVDADLTNGTDNTGVFTQAGITPTPVLPAEQIPLVIQDKTFVPPNFASVPVYSVGLAAVGSGYTNPTVSFSGGCTTLPTATATVGDIADPFGQFIFGAITGITLTSNGAGCTADPVVSIADPTGSGAAAFASLATLAQQDPTWDTSIWGGTGQLWFPHVYVPNQWPTNPDGSGVNAMGRWDYASWFWPPFTDTNYVVRGEIACGTLPGETCPGFPTSLTPAPAVTKAGLIHMGQGSIASLTPEAFMDTPLVNGTAYPSVSLEPKPYRFRILNAANDRTMNLSLFQACGLGGYTPSPTAMPCPTPMAGIAAGTEVGMVPAVATAGFPAWWTSDGRAGGVPDPAAMGPNWVVIGTEGGVLPKPVVVPPAPVDFEYGRRSVTVLNVSTHSLMLMPAERADVIVDFTAFAGKTLILYNDAPAPIPAFDTRYDYYTGDPDQTAEGGAPGTLAGFGPNTRTIMQIFVNPNVVGNPEPALNMATLNKVLPAAFKVAQPVPVVPESVYNNVYGGTYPNTYPGLKDNFLSFIPIGAPAGSLPVTIPLLNKTIQELFELDYGRMNATLGTELPFTNFNTQTTIPLGYVDPTTEILEDSAGVISQPVGVLGDGSQIWKITHNGVDSHAIHFHLFNVQVINRFGWDGTTRPPDPTELGWKDTVRMNPLEIDFVALRPISQTLPWPIPDSIRLLDVTMPPGTTTASGGAFADLNPFTGAGTTTVNDLTNFGWEYVWHCHILGHEENDMMRPIQFKVPPAVPANLALSVNPWAQGSPVILTWTDMSASASQAGGFFNVIISANADYSSPIVNATGIKGSTGFGSVITYPVSGLQMGTTYYYEVQAVTPNGASKWATNSSTISPATTTMSLLAPTIQYGQIGVVTVAVTSAQGTPNGNVLLSVNGGAATTAPLVLLVNTPTAAFNLPNLAIGVYNLVATYPDAANPLITTNQAIGTLTVTTAALTITAPSMTLVYGSAVPTLTPTVVGLVNGDTTSSLAGLNCTTTYTQGSPVSGNPYPTSCSGAVNANYSPITYGSGAITVTQATTTTTITAQNPNPSNLNQVVTFSFTVAPQIFGVPTGNVTVNAATGESCVGALANGAGSCSITFTTSGVRQVTATYAGDGNFLGSVSLGVGQSVNVPAGLTVSPLALLFGNVPVNTNSAPQTVTLTNSGASTVTITGLVFTAAYSRNGGTCGGTLAANRTCTIIVRFRPTSGIAYIGSLTINTNSPLTPNLVVNLSGNGAAPVGVLSSLTPFPIATPRGTPAQGTVILSNTGTAPLTINRINIGTPGSNPGQFTQTNNCGSSLAAGSSCTITITFAPPARTRLGTKTGTLRVRDNSNGLNTVQTTPLQGAAQ